MPGLRDGRVDPDPDAQAAQEGPRQDDVVLAVPQVDAAHDALRREKELRMESNYLGTIAVPSGRLLVLDPCYLPDYPGDESSGSLYMAVYVECEPEAKARIYADLSDEGTWGVRVSALRAVFRERGALPHSVEEVGVAGVDSGQMSMLDSGYAAWQGDERPGGLDDFSPAEHRGEFSYQGLCDLTLGPEGRGGGIGGVLREHNAAVSESGFGDGSYPVCVSRDNDGRLLSVVVHFLWDDEQEAEWAEEEEE
jgi:hypothetical protein